MMEDETESFAERQNNEFELLESIYGDDLIDTRKKDVWKVARPPEFILKLKPQAGMSGKKAYSYLDLRIKFPPMYPNCCPDFKIEDTKGLSNHDLDQLYHEIKDLCKKCVGEVMVLQIAQFVQEFLHDHDVPHFESAYAEMVSYKQQQLEKEAKEEEKKKEIQRRKEEKQRREIEKVLARREEEERKLRKMMREEREVQSAQGGAAICNETNPDQSLQDGVVEIKFYGKISRTVNRGQRLSSGGSGAVVYAGMDASSGEMVAVHHWKILCPNRASVLTTADRVKVDKYLKTISTVEQELQALIKLSHKHILPYLGMKTTHFDDFIEIDILQEYAQGISLQQKVLSKEKVALDTLRCYTEQMLFALDYLHKKSIVHKNFKASSVFLKSTGLLKVADFGTGKRLVDLYEESHIEQRGVRFSDSRIPSRTNKKGDMLRLGIVVLSLAQGCDVSDYPPEVSSAFPPVFQDFLDKCFIPDDRFRRSAAELLEHEFIRPSVCSLEMHHDLAVEDAYDESADDNFEVYKELTSADEKLRTPQLSRLHSEFEELEWLGKGGYGAVVKVRNKLDDRQYAIKRILLDPKQSQLNRKITREVKLLSRLNHENVVRYYNSWIETIVINREDLSDNSSLNLTTSELKPSEIESTRSKNSLGLLDDIEQLAPPPLTSSFSEWSVSVEDVSRHGDIDEDDDDGDVFKTIYMNDREPSSESVLFDHSGYESMSSEEEDNAATTTETLDTTSSSASVITQRFLYIQMEYCEKSTLRQTIDAGLHNETDRVWRLFREILEGLVHVHGQGMIHRDLKPQNIFLDRHDHVKIGDFGLATAHAKVVSGGGLEEESSRSNGDSALTGAVGTALYVAPELLTSSKRTVYSQKVDIYSVGIIFFEMFYSGFSTKMERVKVLGNLRTPSINFPSNFDEASMVKEASIVRWCLDHKPSKRPTALELLQCRLVPTPVLEESHVLNAVREMLVDPYSKQYRLILDEVFNQPVNTSTAVSYDLEVYRKSFSLTNSIIQQRTHEAVSNILQRHGAVLVNIPLLFSRQEKLTQNAETAVFMDTAGTMVVLPDNLRVPFARYVACNGITSIKRYAIDKVYRARKVRMTKPKEFWECAFDIVTPTLAGLIPDAEVISAVSEIISAFPNLASRKYAVRINHMMVLKSILTHCGLPDEEHCNVLNAVAACDKLSQNQASAHLNSLPLNQQQVASLITFTQVQGELSKVQAALRTITKNKQTEVASRARQGLHEMEMLRRNLYFYDIDLPVTFDLGLSHKYHQHYNGLIFQVSAVLQKKKGTAVDVLAIGGRYDKLLQDMDFLKMDLFRKKETDSKLSSTCSAVGVSVAIEKVVAAMAADVTRDSSCTIALFDTSSMASPSISCAAVEVFVYSIGRSEMLKERLKLVKTLWTASIAAETPYDRNPSVSLQEIQTKALNRGVRHLVVLNDKESETATVKLFTHDANTKAVERKVRLEQVVEYLSRKLRGVEEGSSTPANVKTTSPPTSFASSSDSSTSQASSHGGTSHLSIELVPPDKLAFNTKKRLEFEIRAKLSNLPIIKDVSSKITKCAIAVELPLSVMKPFACSLDVDHGEDEFNSSSARHLKSVSKYRKYMSAICEKIAEAKFSRKIVFVFLYSYKDHGYYMLV